MTSSSRSVAPVANGASRAVGKDAATAGTYRHRDDTVNDDWWHLGRLWIWEPSSHEVSLVLCGGVDDIRGLQGARLPFKLRTIHFEPRNASDCTVCCLLIQNLPTNILGRFNDFCTEM